MHLSTRYFMSSRKFYRLLHVFMLLSMIVTLYLLLTHRMQVNSRQDLLNTRKRRYLEYQNRPPREGPGENGQAVKLSDEEKPRAAQLMKNVSFNIVASDKMALDRSIPDTRREECKLLQYPKDLPTVSVVLVFNDEAISPILRTCYSIINRTPPEYLHEIILVDDHSTHEDLKENLEMLVKEHFPLESVKIVRRETRGGLIQARSSGVLAASGDVVMVVDAHMEFNVGWAEPILARIKEKPDAVLMPIVDAINGNDLFYGAGNGKMVNGFTWAMYFWWMEIPQHEKDRRQAVTDPIRSPAMVGCAFAAQREYFLKIGGYDPLMTGVWGGENLELPLRVWMCGGTVEQLPCSRVGHMFRDGHTYSFPDDKGVGRNLKRVAEVWLDDYKRLFYAYKPGLLDLEVGDLTERRALRDKLQCHSFKWFLDNVYPQKFIPDENVYAYGQAINDVSNMCFDFLDKRFVDVPPLSLMKCAADAKRPAQKFSLSHNDEIRYEERCATSEGEEGKAIVMKPCSGNNHQKWRHDRQAGTMVHVSSGKCLDTVGVGNKGAVLLKTCNGQSSQVFRWQNYYEAAAV